MALNYLESFNGWFGEIALDATYDRILSIADNLANYYKKNSSPGQKLVIGYDTRFFAKEFAEFIARVMAKKGIKVFLSNRAVPSSVAIVCAKHKKSLGTLIITGDEYNSKYIGMRGYDMGGYLLNEKDVEPYISEETLKITSPSSLKEYMKKGVIELFDAGIIYELFVHKNIEFKEMSPTHNRLLFNPYYGSGMYYFDYILMNQKAINGVTIYTNRISDFNFKEPNPSSLYKYMFADMKEDNLELGFIVSPDCSSFEFLVGKERLPKIEILQFISEMLTTEEKKMTVLLSDDIEINFDSFDKEKVNFEIVSQNDFYSSLKNGEYDMAMDNFERVYFDNHGAPDALLCGFFLFSFFNRKNQANSSARLYLNELRNK